MGTYLVGYLARFSAFRVIIILFKAAVVEIGIDRAGLELRGVELRFIDQRCGGPRCNAKPVALVFTSLTHQVVAN